MGRTTASHTLSQLLLVNRLPLNPGVPVVPSLVSHVFVVVVPPAPALPLSVTCVVVVVCSTQTRPGVTGTDVSTSLNAVTPPVRPSPPLLFQPLPWQRVTRSSAFQNSHWLSTMPFRVSRRPRKP